jgi:hypothetical protein
VGPVEQLGVDAIALDKTVDVVTPGPHLSHSTRSTVSLPTKSRNVIAPSRGMRQLIIFLGVWAPPPRLTAPLGYTGRGFFCLWKAATTELNEARVKALREI